MVNTEVVKDICTQIKSACDQIISVSDGIRTTAGYDGQLGETYSDILYDCIHHEQLLTLELTNAVTDDEHWDGDGSVFLDGELDSPKGKNGYNGGNQTSNSKGV